MVGSVGGGLRTDTVMDDLTHNSQPSATLKKRGWEVESPHEPDQQPVVSQPSSLQQKQATCWLAVSSHPQV